jgi:predicted RNA-binding Zn-ribbon protein involved in translation (DUF1610 family)
MATAACSECSKTFDTSHEMYPFCSPDCGEEYARRRNRRGRSSTRSNTPRRPGRLFGC